MRSALTTLVRIMWIPVLISGAYLGWIFWQRHAARGVPLDPPGWSANPMSKYGNRVTILQFYSGTRTIGPHEKARVCYGVVNAVAVRLEPPVEQVWPAVSRCFEVAPPASTRYTLTAEGADHAAVSESIDIGVKGR